MDLITREKTKEYLKEWFDDPDIYPLYYTQACEIIDEALDDIPAEFTMAIDYQKKEESDEEKADKERALRVLKRRKMCIEKIVNDDCTDDCRLCDCVVTDKILNRALEYAINYLKEESDEIHN